MRVVGLYYLPYVEQRQPAVIGEQSVRGGVWSRIKVTSEQEGLHIRYSAITFEFLENPSVDQPNPSRPQHLIFTAGEVDIEDEYRRAAFSALQYNPGDFSRISVTPGIAAGGSGCVGEPKIALLSELELIAPIQNAGPFTEPCGISSASHKRKAGQPFLEIFNLLDFVLLQAHNLGATLTDLLGDCIDALLPPVPFIAFKVEANIVGHHPQVKRFFGGLGACWRSKHQG